MVNVGYQRWLLIPKSCDCNGMGRHPCY